MERTADDFGVEPRQISFVSAMRLVCDTWVWCSIAPGVRSLLGYARCASFYSPRAAQLGRRAAAISGP